jgi:hypothetical protein
MYAQNSGTKIGVRSVNQFAEWRGNLRFQIVNSGPYSWRKIFGIVLVVFSLGITTLTEIGLWMVRGSRLIILVVGLVGVWILATGSTKS